MFLFCLIKLFQYLLHFSLLFELLKAPEFVLLPICYVGVAIIYNVPSLPAGSTPLVFDRNIVVDIFRGVVTKWNDPRIEKLNPSLAPFLPNTSMLFYSSLSFLNLKYFFKQFLVSAAITLLLDEDPATGTIILGHTFGLISSTWMNEHGIISFVLQNLLFLFESILSLISSYYINCPNFCRKLH